MIKRKVVRERAKENSNVMTVAIAERRVVIIVRVGVAMIGAVDVVMIGAVDVVMIGVAKDAVLITVTGAGPGGAMMTEAADLATGRKFRRRQDSLPK